MNITSKTKDEVIAEFLVDFDTFEYSQPLVAEVIKASQSDLNIWRSRGFIHIGVDQGSRVFYTGRGLIHAGIVNELAVYLSPKRAAHFSTELLNHVSGYKNPVSDDWVIEFQRPYTNDGLPAENGREMNMAMFQSYGEDRVSLDRASLYLPLDQLVKKWMITARLIKGNRKVS